MKCTKIDCNKNVAGQYDYCKRHLNLQKPRLLEKPIECPVCLEEFTDTGSKQLTCGHWVHIDCICNMQNTSCCPVCRQRIHYSQSMKKKKRQAALQTQMQNVIAFNDLFPFRVVISIPYDDKHDISYTSNIVDRYDSCHSFVEMKKLAEYIKQCFTKKECNHILSIIENCECGCGVTSRSFIKDVLIDAQEDNSSRYHICAFSMRRSTMDDYDVFKVAIYTKINCQFRTDETPEDGYICKDCDDEIQFIEVSPLLV